MLVGEPASSAYYPAITETTGAFDGGDPVVCSDAQLQDVLFCGSSETPGNLDLPPFDCVVPAGEQALKDKKIELENERQNVENDLSLGAIEKSFLLSEINKCLQRVINKLHLLFGYDKRYQDAIDYFAGDNFLVRIQVYGLLIDATLYDWAGQYLASLIPLTEEEQDFVSVQQINIARLNSGVRKASTIDSAFLYAAGQKLFPLSGYARSLYFTLTGERIVIETPVSSGSGKALAPPPAQINAGSSIFPNPANESEVNVRFERPLEQNALLEVFDLTGKLILHQETTKGSMQVAINVSNLASGMSLVKFTGTDRQQNIMDTKGRSAIKQDKAPGTIPGALFHALCLMVWCFTSGISDAQPYFSKSIDLGQGTRERIRQIILIDSSIYVSTGQVCEDGDCTTLVHMDLEGHVLNQRLFTWLDGGDQEYLIHDHGRIILSGHNPFGLNARYLIQICDLNLDSLVNTQYAVMDSVEVLANKSIIAYESYYVLMGFTTLGVNPSPSHLFWINQSDLSLDTIITIEMGNTFTSLNEASIDASGLLNIHFEYVNNNEGRHRGLLRFNGNKELVSIVEAPYQNTGRIRENHLILSNQNTVIMEREITDYELIFLTPDGDYISTTQIQSTIYEGKQVNQLILAQNGDIIGCGISQATMTDTFDFYIGTGFVFRISQSGDMLWDRKIVEFDSTGKPKSALFSDVVELPNGDILLGGGIEGLSIPGNKDMWLVRTDSMGCLTPDCDEIQVITSTTDLDDKTANTQFIIYPNPATDILYIRLEEKDLNKRIDFEIRDVQGMLRRSGRYFDAMAGIDVGGLPPGMYFISVVSQGGAFAVNRFVKY